MEDRSRSVLLCIEGIRAEYEKRVDEARRLYRAAWDEAVDDYDACIAAHYIAHLEPNVQSALEWNQEALARANRVEDERVSAFYPSLYVNLGRSYELLSNEAEARRYYDLAAELGLVR